MLNTHPAPSVKTLYYVALMLLASILVGCATQFANRPPVQQFIQQMSNQYNFNQAQLVNLFNQVKPNTQLITSMTTPHEGWSWYKYQAAFLTPERIQQGVEFWQQHANTLAFAQQHYGVSAAIIVAILGVETNYGRTQGTYPVLDTLSTLAFDYPPRASYFKNELAQYLLLTRENSLPPLAINGSYAGAIGAPQFMPSSYRQYAVDATSKGYSDLMNNGDDAILSVANYFKAHGWATDQPVATPVRLVGERYLSLNTSPKAMLTVTQLRRYGVYAQGHYSPQQQAYLFALAGCNGPEYWLGFHNFAVIMRYNSSKLYAMAVYQLSQQLTQHYAHSASINN